MYVCNCRVAKVNDDDDDVQCNTECVGGSRVANYYYYYLEVLPTPLSLTHTHWQNAEMSCKYDRTSTSYSPSSPSPVLSLSPSRPPDYKHHKPYLGRVNPSTIISFSQVPTSLPPSTYRQGTFKKKKRQKRKAVKF